MGHGPMRLQCLVTKSPASETANIDTRTRHKTQLAKKKKKKKKTTKIVLLDVVEFRTGLRGQPPVVLG